MSGISNADLKWGLRTGALLGAGLAIVPIPIAIPVYLWMVVTGEIEPAKVVVLGGVFLLAIPICSFLGAIGGLIVGSVRDRATSGPAGATLVGCLVGIVLQPVLTVPIGILKGESELLGSSFFWLAMLIGGGVLGALFGLAAWYGQRNDPNFEPSES